MSRNDEPDPVNPLINRIKRRATDAMPAVDARANDQRGGQRKPSDLPGYIWSEKLPAAIACSVRDMSVSGALVHLKSGMDAAEADSMPDRFVLVLTHYRERTEVDCVKVRESRGRIGVRFTSQFRTSQLADRAAAGAGRRR